MISQCSSDPWRKYAAAPTRLGSGMTVNWSEMTIIDNDPYVLDDINNNDSDHHDDQCECTINI